MSYYIYKASLKASFEETANHCWYPGFFILATKSVRIGPSEWMNEAV